MASDRLQELLGTEPPPAVAALPEASLSQLADLVDAARAKQAKDLEVAFEGVLKHVPFPVRPLARKMLKG